MENEDEQIKMESYVKDREDSIKEIETRMKALDHQQEEERTKLIKGYEKRFADLKKEQNTIMAELRIQHSKKMIAIDDKVIESILNRLDALESGE